MLSERRRALMAGGGGWNQIFGFSYKMTEDYQAGEILEEGSGFVYFNFSPSLLAGDTSEYVIARFQNEPRLCVIPREHMKDSNIDAFKVPLEAQYENGFISTGNDMSIMVAGIFNFMNYGNDISYISNSNYGGREHYNIISSNHVPSTDDFYFEFYLNPF